MDDLDARVAKEVAQAVVGAGNAEGRCPRGTAVRRAAEDAVDLDTDAPKRLDVDGPDETSTDDGRADVGDPPHALTHPLFEVYGCLDGLDGNCWPPGRCRTVSATSRFGLPPLHILLCHVKCKSLLELTDDGVSSSDD